MADEQATKHCTKCGQPRLLTEFHLVRRNRDGRNTQCIDCVNANRRRIRAQKANGIFVNHSRQPRLTASERAERALEMQAYQRDYRLRNLEALRKRKKQELERARLQGIQAYGGCCACCGETTHEFLTLQHVNGRSPNTRRVTGKRAWQKLRAQGYPQHDYTVLCFNCNCAIGYLGYCPHHPPGSTPAPQE